MESLAALCHDAKKGRCASPAKLGALMPSSRNPRIVIRGRRGGLHDPFVLGDGEITGTAPNWRKG